MIRDLIDEIFEEVNYELAIEQVFNMYNPTKKEKLITICRTTVEVIWDRLLNLTCIHKEKEYVSSNGPETGWEEFTCKRCNKYWSYIYY